MNYLQQPVNARFKKQLPTVCKFENSFFRHVNTDQMTLAYASHFAFQSSLGIFTNL